MYKFNIVLSNFAGKILLNSHKEKEKKDRLFTFLETLIFDIHNIFPSQFKTRIKNKNSGNFQN